MTILKLAIRGIRSAFGRLLLTIIAIVTGVGFVSGAFILADSLSNSFTTVFEEGFADTDAQVIQPSAGFGDSQGGPQGNSTLPDSLTAEIAALPEVGRATPTVALNDPDSFNQMAVLDINDEPVRPAGPPILAFSWDGETLGGIDSFEGTAPGSNEVALSAEYVDAINLANGSDVAIGDTLVITTPNDGKVEYTLSAIVTFNVTIGEFYLLVDIDTAQQLFEKEGKIDAIDLAAAPGVEVDDLIAAVQQVVPEGAEVLNQADVLADQLAAFDQVIGIIRNILLGFAGVALFVSLFIIYNTFAILVTQRLRQIGMLRAIGATQSQIRWSVVIEGFFVGIIGSLLGFLAGFGFAFMIKAAFQATGGFPETGTVVETRTIVVAFGVGILASVFSALLPATVAARVTPIAAMRNEPPSQSSVSRRAAIGGGVFILGAIALALGLTGTGGEFDALGISLSEVWVVIIQLAIGAILIFLGVIMLSVLFAGPFVDTLGRSSVLGAVMLGLGVGLLALMFSIGDGVPQSVGEADQAFFAVVKWISFFVKLFVATVAIVVGLSILISKARGGKATGIGGSAGALEGSLARQNAARSPRRTAATAGALAIGIALIATVAVMGESLKKTFADSLEVTLKADLYVYNPETFESFSADIAAEIERIDGVAAVSAGRNSTVKLGVDEEGEDDLVGIYGFNAATGTSIINPSIVGDFDGVLGAGEVMLFEAEAEDRNLGVGDSLDIAFDGDGSSEAFSIVALFSDNGSVNGSSIIVDRSTLVTYGKDDVDDTGVLLQEDVDVESVKAEVSTVVREVSADLAVEDRQEFVDTVSGQIDGLTTLINYLLGFTLLVAFVGVINTIVLSVVERTREIGLLRAVGTTRRQIRSMIRWEAVIVCVFGSVLGIGMGVLFAWAGISAVPEGFIKLAIPYESILFTILIAAFAGVLAAVLPAFFAGRKNVLEAISG